MAMIKSEEENELTIEKANSKLSTSDTSKGETLQEAKHNLNDVLETIPLGWFHWRLLLITGLANAADGMEVSLLAFMSVCVGIEWDLSDAQVASIASVVFAGELVGSLLWGPLADKHGRKVVSVASMAVVCAFGYLSALAPNFAALLAFRFGVGVGVGGMAVPFDLLAELLPTSHRGRFLIYLQGFWTMGGAYVVAVAWLMMGSGGWRLVTVMTAVPVTISLGLAMAFLPESPRWLLLKHRAREAEAQVQHIAEVNGTPLAGSLKLKLLSQEEGEGGQEAASFAEFFRPGPQQKLFLPLWIVWFSFGFGYYGVVLLMVRVFQQRAGEEEGATSCDFDYGGILLNSSTEVLAVLLLVLMIEPVGRVKTMFMFFGTAGVSVCFVATPMPPYAFTMLAALVRIAAMGANLSTWVATAEMLPTRQRATGHALATAMERLGSLLSPFLVGSGAAGLRLVSGVLGGVHLAGMLCALALPETQGKDLDAPLGDSESQSEIRGREDDEDEEDGCCTGEGEGDRKSLLRAAAPDGIVLSKRFTAKQ